MWVLLRSASVGMLRGVPSAERGQNLFGKQSSKVRLGRLRPLSLTRVPVCFEAPRQMPLRGSVFLRTLVFGEGGGMTFLVFCHSKEHVCGNAGPAKPVSPSHRGVLFPLLGLKFPLLTSGRIIPHSLYFLRPLGGSPSSLCTSNSGPSRKVF